MRVFVLDLEALLGRFVGHFVAVLTACSHMQLVEPVMLITVNIKRGLGVSYSISHNHKQTSPEILRHKGTRCSKYPASNDWQEVSPN